MPILLMSGGDAALAQAEMPPHSILVRLNWNFPDGSPAVSMDASVFLLNADGVVHDGRAVVFYYQPTDLSGAVSQQSEEILNHDSFQIVLPSIPNKVHKLMFCLTLEATGIIPVFNAVAAIQTQVIELATGNTLVDNYSSSVVGTENGLMVAELYRHDNGWAFRSVDRGFAGRLAALSAHFGVRMAAEDLPQAPASGDWSAASCAGSNQDCACRTTLMMSKDGMTGCELLLPLWLEKMALNPQSVIINLLNEDPIHKVRMLLRRERGCPMTTPEIQNIMRRELLR